MTLPLFTGLARHHLHDTHGQPVQTFHPEINDLQTQVLDLLDNPTSTYTQTPTTGSPKPNREVRKASQISRRNQLSG